MARIRQIKPEFFLDDGFVTSCSRDARLLFIGLWSIADREGRLEDRPVKIKAQLFPYDDDITVQVLSSLIEQLTSEGCLLRYSFADRNFLCVTNFHRHQLVGRDEPPSEIPSPEGEISQYDPPPNGTVRARIYERDHYTCVYCGRNMRNDVRARCIDHVIPYSKDGTNREINLVTSCKKCNASKGNKTPEEAGLRSPDGYGESYKDGPLTPPLTGGKHPPDMKGNGKKEGEWEKEGITDNGVTTTQPGAPKKRRTSQQTGAPDIFDISDSMRKWGNENCPNLDLEVETEKMLDYHRAKGNSFKDWDAAWRTWMRNALQFSGNGAGRLSAGQRGPAWKEESRQQTARMAKLFGEDET